MNDSQLKAMARQKADIPSLRIYVDHWTERLDGAIEDGLEWAEKQARAELLRFVRDEDGE